MCPSLFNLPLLLILNTMCSTAEPSMLSETSEIAGSTDIKDENHPPSPPPAPTHDNPSSYYRTSACAPLLASSSHLPPSTASKKPLPTFSKPFDAATFDITDTRALEDLKRQELRELCELHNVDVARSNQESIARLQHAIHTRQAPRPSLSTPRTLAYQTPMPPSYYPNAPYYLPLGYYNPYSISAAPSHSKNT